jgi:hypothetical protein
MERASLHRNIRTQGLDRIRRFACATAMVAAAAFSLVAAAESTAAAFPAGSTAAASGDTTDDLIWG